MRSWTIGCLLGLLFTSCSPPLGTTNDVQIRIANRTGAPLDAILVIFPTETFQYGFLPAGASSAYHRVSQAYRYAYVKTSAGGDEFVLQPIDYVGETLLKPGRYTYALSFTTPPRQLTLELEP